MQMHIAKEDVFPLRYMRFGSQDVPVPATTRLLDAEFPGWRTTCGAQKGSLKFVLPCDELHRTYGYYFKNATMSFVSHDKKVEKPGGGASLA